MNRNRLTEIVKPFRDYIEDEYNLYCFDGFIDTIFYRQSENERPCQKCPNKEPLSEESLVCFVSFFLDIMDEVDISTPDSLSIINSGHINIVWKDMSASSSITLTFSRKSRQSISFIINSDNYRIAGYYKNSTDFVPHFLEVFKDLLEV